MLKAHLLGRFQILLADQAVEITSRPAQSLLAYLLLNPGKALRREKLASMFWPEASESNARANLRHALWRIRKALENEAGLTYLQTDDLTVTLLLQTSDWLDVAEFERSIGAPGEGLSYQVEAYSGEFLPGFYEEWAILERQRLQALFDQKMQYLLEELLGRESWDELIRQSETWIQRSFTPEPAYRMLMLGKAGKGDLAGVAAAYQRGRDALRTLAGTQLSLQTQQLFDELRLGQHPAEVRPLIQAEVRRASQGILLEESPSPGNSPYKGLMYYDEADAPLFFGREQLTARLVRRLGEWPFLAVVGASGSGKSSLLRAGVIPALRRDQALADGNLPPEGSERWALPLFTPTAYPLVALANALLDGAGSTFKVQGLVEQLKHDPGFLLTYANSHPPAHTLLVIDQFEELFSLCRQEDERQAFIDNLMAACGADAESMATGPFSVVIGMRADFYAPCARYPRLRQALARFQEYIGPMEAEELRRAIELPAQVGGWAIEPGLVELLLRDTGREPGGLPLLSHALLETWQRRRGRALTTLSYAAAGGVHSAIARTAETVFANLNPAQQELARSIFLRLTELKEIGDEELADPGTRRRAALSELLSLSNADPAQRQETEFVLNTLVQARLVITGQQTAEVAHEALIREWPTLRQWLLEDRQGLALQRHLTESAQNWENLNRDPGELYRGARLSQALEWAAAHSREMTVLESEFLAAARAQQEQEVQEREAQRQRQLSLERRARRFLQTLVWVLVAAVLLSGGLALWANTQRQEALRQASVGLAAQALNELEGAMPERGVLLALEALEYYPYTAQAESALAQAVEEVRRYSELDTQSVIQQYPQASQQMTCLRVFWLADSKTIACINNVVVLWDADSLQLLSTYPDVLNHPGEYTSNITAAAPDSGGQRWVLASNASVQEGVRLTPRIWDINKNLSILLSETITEANSLDWSADGSLLASAHQDGAIRIWQADPPRQVGQFTGHAGPVSQVDVSPDGRQLASASLDGTLRVWQLPSGTTLLSLVHGSPVNQASWSPDGQRLASGAADGVVRIWDAGSGELLFALAGHTGAISYLAWAPDGERLASGSTDGSVRIWDALNGNQELILRGTTGEIYSLAWSPEGDKLAVSAAYQNSVRIWDVERKTLRLSGHTDWMVDTQWSPDSKYLATSSQINGWGIMPPAGDAWVFDATTGEKLFPIMSSYYLDWAPDGRRLVTVANEAYIWEIPGGRQLRVVPGFHPWSLTASWSADSRRIALSSGPAGGGDDYATIIFDAESGQRLITIRQPCFLHKPVWYPRTDDFEKVNWLLTGCLYSHINAPGPAIVWDAASGKKVFELPEERGETIRAAWSPDGRYIAAGTDYGLVRIWDVATRKVKQVYAGHAYGVWDVAWSPDGSRLISGDSSGIANVWIAKSGETVMTIKTPGTIFSVDWRPDGQYVAVTGSYQPPVIRRAWPSTLALIAYAKECCAWRALTADERTQFGLAQR